MVSISIVPIPIKVRFCPINISFNIFSKKLELYENFGMLINMLSEIKEVTDSLEYFIEQDELLFGKDSITENREDLFSLQDDFSLFI